MRSGSSGRSRRSGILLACAGMLLLIGPIWGAGNKEENGGGTEPGSVPQAATASSSGSSEHHALQALGTTDLQAFINGMEADRLLLAEIRKDLPDKRAEADLFLKRLKALAGQSDPVHLVPKVNRLIEQEPIYYDWLEKNANTQGQNQGQSASEYVVGGARGFVIAFQDFQNALLLTVINRLDMAERALQEATIVPAK